jgi:hypothetical protein
MKRSGGTAGRPLAHLTITQLEALVATSRDKPDELRLVLAELGHRKSKRAGALRDLVRRRLDSQAMLKNAVAPPVPVPTAAKVAPPTPTKPSKPNTPATLAPSASSFKIESMLVDTSAEIERYATFDHKTRRFIAYALSFTTPWPGAIGGLHEGPNAPLPFAVSEAEAAERAEAYAGLGALRAANVKGGRGQAMRREAFGILLAMAKVDLKWKRLIKQDQFIFCYERLAGHMWRQLLVPCWGEAVRQRKNPGATQLPLDRRLIDDAAIPKSLENDPAPKFYPHLSDADAIGLPLLGML